MRLILPIQAATSLMRSRWTVDSARKYYLSRSDGMRMSSDWSPLTVTKVRSVKRPADASRTAAQWMALGGIFGPLLRDLTLLVASLATPGYSQIRQPLSDLGVGSNAQVVDALEIVSGLLLLAFTAIPST